MQQVNWLPTKDLKKKKKRETKLCLPETLTVVNFTLNILCSKSNYPGLCHDVQLVNIQLCLKKIPRSHDAGMLFSNLIFLFFIFFTIKIY